MSAYGLALLSAVAMASIVLMDVLMRRGVYTRWSQPLIVSCALNPVFAAPVYLFVTWHQPPAEAILMALASGMVLALANGVYFAVLFSPAGESAEVAAFDSSAPVGIALISGVMALAGMHISERIGVHQWVGVLIASGSLALMHVWSPHYRRAGWPHRLMLIAFTFTNAIHMMLVDAGQKMAAEEFASRGMENPEFAGMMATYPFYWAGLLAGVLPFLLKRERREFLLQLPVMVSKWRVIVLAEIIATVAFVAQLGGFAGGHVAVIAMLCGSFSLMVFLGGIVLRRLGVADAETFPIVNDPWRKVLVISILLVGIALGSWVIR